jgi:hypothetical protein
MSRPHHSPLSDAYLRGAQQRVADQEALVRRMIIQGAPTQAAEDRLHQLQQVLSRVKGQYSRTRAHEIQRGMRDRRSR